MNSKIGVGELLLVSICFGVGFFTAWIGMEDERRQERWVLAQAVAALEMDKGDRGRFLVHELEGLPILVDPETGDAHFLNPAQGWVHFPGPRTWPKK